MTKIIILDDDPTGTQTVQNVSVLTVWDIESLLQEVLRPEPLFFVLTNTRAMPEKQAVFINEEIAQNIGIIQNKTGIKVTIISRSDSTLRGHFPAEPEALQKGLGKVFNAWFLIPFFEEGGRFTKDDIHYLMENGKPIPVSETPFAKDAAFGYKNSNLKHWVEEKTQGKIQHEEVVSISLNDLKNTDIQTLIEKISQFSNQQIVIVNAKKLEDLRPLAKVVLSLPHKHFLYRTAASWIKILKHEIDGLPYSKTITLPQITHHTGGLIVVGSYVPKTTEQLKYLLKNNPRIQGIELDISQLNDKNTNLKYLEIIQELVDNFLTRGEHVVIYTSREILYHANPEKSLKIGNRISEGLISIVKNLKVRPQFLIAKGGITSSDVATKALGVKRAIVQGQLLAGVPVWETQEESLFPKMQYVIFPGNVGDKYALRKAFELLA